VNIDKQPDPFSSSSIVCGNKTVTNAGTRVQLSSTTVPCSSVIVVGKAANSGTVWIGCSLIAAGSGLPILPLQERTIKVDNLQKVWIDADTNGDGITYLYLL
jgi:hypothetical protein